MAEPTPTSCDKSLIDAINTVKKIVKNSDDAAFAVRQIAELSNAILSKPATSQQTKDNQQDAASASNAQQSSPAPLPDTGNPSPSHSSAPNNTLVLRLPSTLKESVGKYQQANLFVLKNLIKYGGFNHKPNSELPAQLDFLDAWGDVCTMNIGREPMYGCNESIPHIRASQYGALLDSMCNRYETREAPKNVLKKPSAQQKFREMSARLNSAIEGRTVVHNWHLALPQADPRLDDNFKYAAFLETLKALKERMKFWS